MDPAAYTHLFLGKSTFFVYNQSKIDNLPAEKLVTLEAQLKEAEEENKLLTAEVKSLSAGVWFHNPFLSVETLTLVRTGEDKVHPYRCRTRRAGRAHGRKGAHILVSSPVDDVLLSQHGLRSPQPLNTWSPYELTPPLSQHPSSHSSMKIGKGGDKNGSGGGRSLTCTVSPSLPLIANTC